MPREDRPPHQLFDKCAKCGEQFKAGDSVWISVENDPICEKCGRKDMTEPVSYADWVADGTCRFGPNMIDWKFACPVCGNVAATGDFRQYAAQGSIPNSATCECIGRYTGAKSAVKGIKPCNYAGYGLFRLSPVRITMEPGVVVHAFAFAEPADDEGIKP